MHWQAGCDRNWLIPASLFLCYQLAVRMLILSSTPLSHTNSDMFEMISLLRLMRKTSDAIQAIPICSILHGFASNNRTFFIRCHKKYGQTMDQIQRQSPVTCCAGRLVSKWVLA